MKKKSATARKTKLRERHRNGFIVCPRSEVGRELIAASPNAFALLAKNGHELHTLFALANVMIGARQATG